MNKLVSVFTIIFFLSNLSLFNCAFQSEIFKKMNTNFINKNLVISPFSLFHILSLTTNGAGGLTQKELLTLLQSSSLNSLNDLNFDFIEILKDFSTLETANAIMTSFTPLEPFIETSEKYLAPFEPLVSVEKVNEWVSKKTHGKILKIMEQLDPNSKMVLLNAIYFKGQWENIFDKSLTTKSSFYNFGNTDNEVSVEMMRKEQRFMYLQENSFQAIELPYTKDAMSALIILPSEGKNINDFIKEGFFNEENISKITKLLVRTKVTLKLPKFEVEFEDKLKQVLIDMGIKTGFTDDADFTGLRKENDVKIGNVFHKTYLKVNEEGTEATGATAVEIVEKSMSLGQAYMTVNRPFVFIIRSRNLPEGNDILFMAKIEEIN